MLGLADLIVDTLGSGTIPYVQEQVAELITQRDTLWACLRAYEADETPNRWGYEPALPALRAGRTLFGRSLYTRMVEIIQLLGTSSLMALPAEADFDTDIAAKVDQYMATDTVNATEADPVAAIRELTGGRGVDHAFEAVGLPMLVDQAVRSLAIRGTATIVGVLPAGAKIEFPWEALRPECRLQTSRMGSNAFRFDIPNYLELYEQGRLRLDEMISRRIPLDEINDAFRAMDEGEGARSVVVFD